MSNYRYPGQVLECIRKNGYAILSLPSIPSGLLTSAVSNSSITTTVESSDEVVNYEVNLGYLNTSAHRYMGILIYRDSTEIFNTYDGIANSTATVRSNFYTSFIDRPGPGTYTYSYRTNAVDATSDCDNASSWVMMTRSYLPTSILTITSNTLSF